MTENSSNAEASVFTAGSQPFTTQDAALAFSLYLAGVPFADPSQPCFNLYDAEILKKLGFPGLTLEQAAQAAHNAGKKGEVRYIFARTPELNNLLESYKAQQAAINDGEGTAVEHLAGLIPDADLRLKVAELVLKLRPQFVNMWKDQSPLIRVPNPGESTTRPVTTFNRKGNPIPGKEVSSPGVRIISLNATPATKKRLRL